MEQQYVAAIKKPFFHTDKLTQKLEQLITNISMMFSQSDVILLIFFQTPIIGYQGIHITLCIKWLTSHSVSSDNLKTAWQWLAQISKLFWIETSKHTEIIFFSTRLLFIEALLYQDKERGEESHACW